MRSSQYVTSNSRKKDTRVTATLCRNRTLTAESCNCDAGAPLLDPISFSLHQEQWSGLLQAVPREIPPPSTDIFFGI